MTLHCDDGRVLRIPYGACHTLELGYCLSIHAPRAPRTARS